MNLVAEMDLRQVLIEGFHELAQDEAAIVEMIERSDDLRQGSQTQWRRDMIAIARDLVNPKSPRCVDVRVGYPTAHGHLPAVGIVNDMAGEDQSGAMVGDVLSVQYPTEGAAPDPSVGALLLNDLRYAPLPDPAGGTDYPAQDPPRKTFVETTTGTDYRTVLECTCWAVEPEIGLVLQAMVRWALFRGKGSLQDAGAYDVSFDEGGVQPDPKMEPRVGYVPVVRCTLFWTYRQTRRGGRVPNGDGGVRLTSTPTY